jgi:two-component system cell cycle sensor histidine kinase/response regulator CckA
VVEAEDGLAALDIFQSASEPFDLVVTDSRMPRLDGPHLAACLRDRDATLPIIHLSGSHGGERRHGVPDDVPTLLKPFQLPDLLDQAERLIRAQESGRP